MPAIYECANHDVCGGYVIGISKTHLCAKCSAIARQNERDEAKDREYARLNEPMKKPDPFGEIEKGRK